jgi:hypothetical protein
MAHPCAGVQWARNTTERVGGGCNQRAHNPTAPRREPGKRETWQGSTASTQRAHNTMRGPPLTLFFGWPAWPTFSEAPPKTKLLLEGLVATLVRSVGGVKHKVRGVHLESRGPLALVCLSGFSHFAPQTWFLHGRTARQAYSSWRLRHWH